MVFNTVPRDSEPLHPNLTASDFNSSSSAPTTHDPKWCQGCSPSPPTLPTWVGTSEPRKAPTSTLKDASRATPSSSTAPEEWPQGLDYHCPIFLG